MSYDDMCRLYSHDSGYYWLSPRRESVDAGRRVEIGYRCEIRLMPCWPVACHPRTCGLVVGYGPRRPSAGLAVEAGELVVRRLFERDEVVW